MTYIRYVYEVWDKIKWGVNAKVTSIVTKKDMACLTPIIDNIGSTRHPSLAEGKEEKFKKWVEDHILRDNKTGLCFFPKLWLNSD